MAEADIEEITVEITEVIFRTIRMTEDRIVEIQDTTTDRVVEDLEEADRTHKEVTEDHLVHIILVEDPLAMNVAKSDI